MDQSEQSPDISATSETDDEDDIQKSGTDQNSGKKTFTLNIMTKSNRSDQA